MAQEMSNPIYSQPLIANSKGLEYSKNGEVLNEIKIKIYKANELNNYINRGINNEKIVPSFLGIEDPILASLINEYNRLQLQYTSDLNTYAPKSEILEKQKLNLEEIRISIQKRCINYKSELNSMLVNFAKKNSEIAKDFSTLPQSKRVMKSIGRQGSIKETIYVYLMQKREETLVTLASTTSNYFQIDQATVPNIPTKPSPKKIKIFSFLLGIMLPIIFIYLKSIFNNKIENRSDLTKNTNAPILGDIGHHKDQKVLEVAHKSRNVISEQLRIIRTNLQFILGSNKVILVTSSISGEGKSFVSLNLGAVFAISDKKVAVLEFDLRKQRIIKILETFIWNFF